MTTIGHNNPASLKSETRANVATIYRILTGCGKATRTSKVARLAELTREQARYALRYMRRRGLVARAKDSKGRKAWILTGTIPTDAPPVKPQATKNKNLTNPCKIDAGIIKSHKDHTGFNGPASVFAEFTPATVANPSDVEITKVADGRKRKTFGVKSRSGKAKNRKGNRAAKGFQHRSAALVSWLGPVTVAGDVYAVVEYTLPTGAKRSIRCTEAEADAMAFQLYCNGTPATVKWGYPGQETDWNTVETLDAETAMLAAETKRVKAMARETRNGSPLYSEAKAILASMR